MITKVFEIFEPKEICCRGVHTIKVTCFWVDNTYSFILNWKKIYYVGRTGGIVIFFFLFFFSCDKLGVGLDLRKGVKVTTWGLLSARRELGPAERRSTVGLTGYNNHVRQGRSSEVIDGLRRDRFACIWSTIKFHWNVDEPRGPGK